MRLKIKIDPLKKLKAMKKPKVKTTVTIKLAKPPKLKLKKRG